MKKNNRLRRSDVLWGLAVAALVLLQFWWLPGEAGTTSDSFSTTIDGKLGLYRTLTALFPGVTRNNQALIPDNSRSVLLVVAPDRYPTSVEEQDLVRYVQQGGLLLFAPNWNRAPCSLPSLGIALSPKIFTEVTSVTAGTPLPVNSPPATPGAATPPENNAADVQPQAELPEPALPEPALPEALPEPAVPEAAVPEAQAPSDSPSAVMKVSGAPDSTTVEAANPAEVPNSAPGLTTAPFARQPDPIDDILRPPDRSDTGLRPPSGRDRLPLTDAVDDLEPLDPPVELQITSVLSPGVTSWRTRATLTLPRQFQPETLVASEDGAEVAFWPLGMGGVMVSSSPDVFSNRSLLFPDSRRLAVRLVEFLHRRGDPAQVAGTPIVISEYLNASDAYRHTGVLFSPVLRMGSLQLILLAVLSLWYGFHRFGPVQASQTQRRRSLTESAAATGNLLYRLQDGGVVVSGYLDYLRSQLRRRFGNTVRLDQYELLSTRTGIPAEQLKERLSQAERLAQTAAVPPAQAAATLRWLASFHGLLNRTDHSAQRVRPERTQSPS